MTILAGVDLSMSNVGISLWSIPTKECIKLIVLSSQPKRVRLLNDTNVVSAYKIMHVATDNIANACYIAQVMIDVLKDYNISLIVIEDYAYTMFKSLNTAEFTGVIKYLVQLHICRDIIPVAVSTVKKFATTNGRASKDLVVDKFLTDVGISKDHDKTIFYDIADAYFIGKYAIQNLV